MSEMVEIIIALVALLGLAILVGNIHGLKRDTRELARLLDEYNDTTLDRAAMHRRGDWYKREAYARADEESGLWH